MHRCCTLLGLVLTTASWAGPDAGIRSTPMELRRNMPFVQVQVTGRGPFTFGIDTGTGAASSCAPSSSRSISGASWSASRRPSAP